MMIHGDESGKEMQGQLMKDFKYDSEAFHYSVSDNGYIKQNKFLKGMCERWKGKHIVKNKQPETTCFLSDLEPDTIKHIEIKPLDSIQKG